MGLFFLYKSVVRELYIKTSPFLTRFPYRRSPSA